MKKLLFRVICALPLTLIIVFILIKLVIPYGLHIYRIRNMLKELAADQVLIEERLANLNKLGKGYWARDHVGITRDGYVFYYDIHNTHMEGRVGDINIFYLPDDDRYFYNIQHYCGGPDFICKMVQPCTKDDLIKMFD